MKKIKIFFDPRREEKWLNSIEGYKLIRVGIVSYTFEESCKQYDYALVYTPSKMNYLKLLNNLKSYTKEIKHQGVWTYLAKERKYKTFYRSDQEQLESINLFIKKYSLYSQAFLLFAIAFVCLGLYFNIYFMICAALLGLLSLLYHLCIKQTTKKINHK